MEPNESKIGIWSKAKLSDDEDFSKYFEVKISLKNIDWLSVYALEVVVEVMDSSPVLDGLIDKI